MTAKPTELGSMGEFFNACEQVTESRKGLYLLLSLSLVLKSMVVIFDPVINPDGALYLNIAREFAAGHFRGGMAIDRGVLPLYPLLIALLHQLIPDWIVVARCFSVLTLVLTLIPLYLITQDLFDNKAAFWACAALTLSPVQNLWAADVIRDPAFVFCLAWAVYFAIRAMESPRAIFFVLAAASSLLSLLFRIEGLAFLVLFTLFFLYLALRGEHSRKDLLKGLMLFCTLPALLLVALLLFLGSEWTSFNRIDSILSLAAQFFDLDFLDKYRLTYQQLDVMRNHPALPQGGFLAETAMRLMPLIYLLGFLQSLCSALHGLFLVPLALAPFRPLHRGLAFVLALIGLQAFIPWYFLLSRDELAARYLVSTAFLLYPWVGAGMARITSMAGEQSRRSRFAFIFLALFWLSPPVQVVKNLFTQDQVVRVAGEWLAKQEELRTVKWACSDRRIPFYAGRGEDYLLLQGTDYLAMEQSAREKDVGLFIIRTSRKRMQELPGFTSFERLKDFTGTKNLVVLYYSGGKDGVRQERAVSDHPG
jgi:hypothetical protein